MDKRWTNHYALMLVIIVSGDCTLPKQFCVMKFLLICLKQSTVHLTWSYLVICNVLTYR